MYSTFDRIRVIAGVVIALIGIGVLVFVGVTGFTNLVLACFGALFILVGVSVALASKDSDLATEILAFLNIFR